VQSAVAVLDRLKQGIGDAGPHAQHRGLRDAEPLVTSYPAKPPVSFRTYRQLSGWNPPPLVIRAYRAHCHRAKAAAFH
jgi:hypothetical protein